MTRPKIKCEPEANSGVDWADHNQFMQIAFAEEGLLVRFIEK